MKKTIMLLISLLFFTSTAFAEGKKGGKGGDGFRKAAIEYDAKAKKNLDEGNAEIAALYRKQAAIKRRAAALADQGKWKEISWDEYHKNEAKNQRAQIRRQTQGS